MEFNLVTALRTLDGLAAFTDVSREDGESDGNLDPMDLMAAHAVDTLRAYIRHIGEDTLVATLGTFVG